MKFFIKKFENRPVNSNCFLIFNEQNTAIIIDPGTQNHIELYDFIKKEKLKVEYCIITHGHFDHICGIENIDSRYNPKYILSNESLAYIKNAKKNLSVFHGETFTYDLENYITISEDGYKIDWNGLEVVFYITKGHSDSCISFRINRDVFVGDLMIKGEKTVTKLPTGNKIMVQESIIKILRLDDELIIHCGHGELITKNDAKKFFLDEN